LQKAVYNLFEGAFPALAWLERDLGGWSESLWGDFMPTFRYKARDKDGQEINGDIEAVSATELKEALFSEGMISGKV